MKIHSVRVHYDIENRISHEIGLSFIRCGAYIGYICKEGDFYYCFTSNHHAEQAKEKIRKFLYELYGESEYCNGGKVLDRIRIYDEIAEMTITDE